MDYKIGQMVEVDGEFGNVVGYEGDYALVFMLRRGETVPVDPEKIAGIKAEAATPKQNTGEPEEPKGAADTAIRLWSMGYRGKHLADQMEELGFSKSESEKAIAAAQDEYRARREDGGGYWEIQKDERVKLANGEWGRVVEAERDGSIGVEFNDGKRELILESDLDDKFLAGRRLMGRIDNLIGMIEGSLEKGADEEIEISYQAPGGARERKRFRNQEEMGKFLKEMDESGKGKVEIEVGAAEEWVPNTVMIMYSIKGDPDLPKMKNFKNDGDAQKFIEKLEEKYGVGAVDVRFERKPERTAADPAPNLETEPEAGPLREEWRMPSTTQKPVVTVVPKEIQEEISKAEKQTLKPLEHTLTDRMDKMFGLYQELEKRQAELDELKAKAKQMWQTQESEYKTMDKQYRELFSDLMSQIRSMEGKAEDGKNILRTWKDILLRIGVQVKRAEGKPLVVDAQEGFELLLQTLADELDDKAIQTVYDTIQAIMDTREAGEEWMELEPKGFKSPGLVPEGRTAGILEDVGNMIRSIWDRIRDLGRRIGESMRGTETANKAVDDLETALDMAETRSAARRAVRGRNAVRR